MWVQRLNAVLGSLVVTVGFWLIWGDLSLALALVLALAVVAVLAWRGSTVAEVWAWALALLGLESLAWPVVTMVRVRMQSSEPTEQQMGVILTAVLFGLFSSIFWLTFSYGLFRWIGREKEEIKADQPR
ncbi:MAG: hypothetical protein ACREIS_02575 [Nitrospiraceae bacterium]